MAGSPSGGQFAPVRRSESRITLDTAAAAVDLTAGLAVKHPAADQALGGEWETPTEIPDFAVLHTVSYRQDTDGNVDGVFCSRCGADVESYDMEAAADVGADPCDEAE